jgi:DNA-binding CsgD family transcriptional regulator
VGRIEACGRLGTTSVPHAELLTGRAGLAQALDKASSPLWARAADAWAAMGFPWWESSCRLSYAEALLRSRGARGAASAVVGDARRVAAALGAEGLVAAADRLVASAGLVLEDPDDAAAEVAPAAADDLLAALTARERDVVALLVEGLSNRAIAERLFISEKTASVHVSNILAKLGVSSRLQAATLVRDLARDAGTSAR